VPRTKQRTPELRNRVLHVAIAMLDEQGVAAFTTRSVAERAQTSVPAVYELFGDKAGLVREMFFEGFAQLHGLLDALAESEDPRADLLALVDAYRSFVRGNPVLAAVMFSRPFADFDPGPADVRKTGSVRRVVVERVRRCIDAGVLSGDETDIAHALLALAQGLVAQENAGWLGSSKASVDRRWSLAFQAMLTGLGHSER
jgi:AcrR family transcriptional regulator